MNGAQCAALGFVADEVAFADEGAEVVADAVGGADFHVLADLANRGRIADIIDALDDKIEHHLLAFGEALH